MKRYFVTATQSRTEAWIVTAQDKTDAINRARTTRTEPVYAVRTSVGWIAMEYEDDSGKET